MCLPRFDSLITFLAQELEALAERAQRLKTEQSPLSQAQQEFDLVKRDHQKFVNLIQAQQVDNCAIVSLREGGTRHRMDHPILCKNTCGTLSLCR